MRILLTILLVSLSYLVDGQLWVNRSTSSITAVDQRLKAAQNLYIPVLSDTALLGGYDSLGAILQVRSTGNVYIRDTNLISGGHKWTKLLKTGDVAATTWGSITGLLSNQADLYDTLNHRFKQNGNTFGDTARLGTNDDYPLLIKRNGQSILSIENSAINGQPYRFFSQGMWIPGGGISIVSGTSPSPNAFRIADGLTFSYGGAATGAGMNRIITAGGTEPAYTSGEGSNLFINTNFIPTSGNGIFSYLKLQGNILQTGGANGTSRGLYIKINPSGATDFRAMQTDSGTVMLNVAHGSTTIGLSNNMPLAKFHVVGTGLFTDTVTATTMGNPDSSNRVASTAWVKRQGYGSGSGGALTNLGDAYRLLVPNIGIKTLDIIGPWLNIDTTTYTDKIRMSVDPQVGFGLKIAPITDVILADTARITGLPSYYYVDSSIAAVPAGGNISGSLTAGRVTLSLGPNTIGDDAGFTYDAPTNKVTTDTVSAKKIIYDSAHVSNSAFKPYINSFNAFGNSITVGIGISYPDSIYIARIADTLLVPYTNYAISGSGARATITQHNRYVSGPINNAATFIMTGYNDASLAGAGMTNKTPNKVAAGIGSAAVNHFADSYAEGSAGYITRNGTWSLYQDATLYGGKTNRGALTTTINDSIKYTFVGTTIAAVLIGGDSLNFNSSIVEVFVDNVSKGEFNTNNQADGVSLFPFGADNRIPFPIIISGLSPGTHTIKLVNKAARAMFVDYFAPMSPNKARFVVFHNIQYSAPTRQVIVNNKIDSLVAAFPAGFSILKITTNSVFNPATGGNIDLVHLNVVGNSQVLKAFRNAHDSTIVHTEGTTFRTDGAQFVVNRTYKRLPTSGEVWTKSDGNIQVGGHITLPYWGTIRQGISTVFRSDSGRSVVSVGSNALGVNTAGFNTAVGINALTNNASGSGNVAVGSLALNANTTGGSLTGVGHSSLLLNTTGTNLTALGANVLRSNTTGNNNTAGGQGAMFLNTTGSDNTVLGASALSVSTTAWGNAAFGYGALQNATGQANIAIGAYAMDNASTASKQIAVCYQCDLPRPDLDGQAVIGNFLYARGITAVAKDISPAKVGIIDTSFSYTFNLGGTDGMKMNGGTTAQRGPSVTGAFRWNTDSVRFEMYTGTKWVTFMPGDASLTTLYTGNGTLSGARTITMAGNAINFSGGDIGIDIAPLYDFHIENSTAIAAFINTTALGSTSGGVLALYAKALPTASSQRIGYISFRSAGGATNDYEGGAISVVSRAAWTGGSSHSSSMAFLVTASGNSTPSTAATAAGGGRWFFGGSTISTDAWVQLAAGSTSTVPLKFVSGTDPSSPSAGMVAFNGTRWAFSPSTTLLRLPLFNDVTPTAGGILQGDGTNFTLLALGTANQMQRVNGAGTALEYFTPTFATSNIYTADGFLNENRTLDGAEVYDLRFNNLDTFYVTSLGKIVMDGTFKINQALEESIEVSAAGTLSMTTMINYIASGTTATFSLPTGAAVLLGRIYRVKNRGSGNLTVDVTGGSSTIYDTGAVSSIIVVPGASRSFIWDGSFWNLY